MDGGREEEGHVIQDSRRIDGRRGMAENYFPAQPKVHAVIVFTMSVSGVETRREGWMGRTAIISGTQYSRWVDSLKKEEKKKKSKTAR